MIDKKVQTMEQAIAALESAGHRVFNGRVYDPRIRGAYATLEGGYCDADYSDYVLAESDSRRKGGPTGAFRAEIREILEADRRSR